MKMTLPNILTMFRIVLIPFFVGALFLLDTPTNRLVGVSIFIIASVTDFFDGYLARKMNLVSNFGKFMDPLADKLLVMSALVAMISLGDLQAWIVILILAREFTITGFRTLALEANIVISASWWGKVKTTVQMIMIIVILFEFSFPYILVIENILISLSVALTIISAVDYIWKNKKVLES